VPAVSRLGGLVERADVVVLDEELGNVVAC
jgi:hypothetical protein